MVRPVRAYLVGSVTETVGAVTVPVADLFVEAVAAVLRAATRSEAIVAHTRCEVVNTAGAPYDNLPGFFHPRSPAEVREVLVAQRRANDTVFVTGWAPHSRLEQVVIDVENRLNALEHPLVGSDVKVLGRRLDRRVDLVACVPAVAERTPDLATYRTLLDDLHQGVTSLVQERWATLDAHAHRVSVALNTKDDGARVYLAPFGTSLGKGDVGVVGRGNRYSGTISSARPASVEAPAGKNPLHHAGKLYTIAATRIAQALHGRTGYPHTVLIAARNGGDLSRPHLVAIDGSTAASTTARSLVEEELDRVTEYADLLAQVDPLTTFRSAAGWLA